MLLIYFSERESKDSSTIMMLADFKIFLGKGKVYINFKQIKVRKIFNYILLQEKFSIERFTTADLGTGE